MEGLDEKIERLERELAEIHTALISRGDIGVAKGLLMQRFSITEAQAFELLRRLSSEQNIKLRDVAADLIRTREFPAGD